MKKIVRLILMIGILTLLFSCAMTEMDQKAGQEAQIEKMGDQDSAAYQPRAKEVDVHTAYRWVKKYSGSSFFVILDVRTPDEFAGGHINKAINIDYLANDFIAKISKLDKNKTYLVNCRSGKRSLAAVEEMNKLGIYRAYSMKGGILAWINSGYPVVK